MFVPSSSIEYVVEEKSKVVLGGAGVVTQIPKSPEAFPPYSQTLI